MVGGWAILVGRRWSKKRARKTSWVKSEVEILPKLGGVEDRTEETGLVITVDEGVTAAEGSRPLYEYDRSYSESLMCSRWCWWLAWRY